MTRAKLFRHVGLWKEVSHPIYELYQHHLQLFEICVIATKYRGIQLCVQADSELSELLSDENLGTAEEENTLIN